MLNSRFIRDETTTPYIVSIDGRGICIASPDDL